jgi:hypothetical protein
MILGSIKASLLIDDLASILGVQKLQRFSLKRSTTYRPKRGDRYDGKALREIRKRKGVGRPPAVNLARMPISAKVSVNQAWFAWAERRAA